MKKITTLMLLLALAGSAKADLVLKAKGSIDVCPGLFTTSGNSVVHSINDNVVTIYTSDFLVDKTFTCVKSEYQWGSVIEVATVTPTGLNIVPDNIYGSKNYYTSYMFEASSGGEMINKMKEYDPSGTLFLFTDPMGNFACYFYEGYSFKYENLFGKKYPTSWYALIDGYVYCINTYDSFYTLAYNEESAVWTRISEDIETRNDGILGFSIVYEGEKESYKGIRLSQNIFNTDDKWEYVVSEYGPLEFSYYIQSEVINDDGTITLTRRGSCFGNPSSYAVFNEDGTKLGSLPSHDGFIPDGFIINGKKYVTFDDDDYECLYEIVGNDSDFDLIETVQAKSDRRLDAKRGIVTVDINTEQAGGEVVVSTTDGKVMASKKVGVGQTQINEQPLPTGIYVVSLLRDGRVVESEKYLVQ